MVYAFLGVFSVRRTGDVSGTGMNYSSFRRRRVSHRFLIDQEYDWKNMCKALLMFFGMSFPLIPGTGFLMEFGETFLIHVEHMPGRVVAEGHVILHFIVCEDMVVYPFRRIERSRQIVITAKYPDVQKFITGKQVPYRFFLI